MYFVFGLAALVPFEDLSEPNLQRHYQLKPDEEITQYAEEASTVKKVNSEACLLLQQMQNHIFLWNFLDPCLGIWKDLAIQSMHIFRNHGLTDPSINKWEVEICKIYTSWLDSVFWVMMCCGFLQVKVLAKFYWGDPKEKLVKAVLETPLDALVMGSRGYGTFAR